MKKYTHAWLALKAVQLLESYRGKFAGDRNQHLDELLDFLSSYPSTFVRGAWFPDEVIKDNVQGGHTWKYFLDPVNGRSETRRPPAQNQCMAVVLNCLDQKISLDTKISDLPDRCEALSQSIRDMVLITNKVKSGDVIAFNDSQVAIAFLMLAHYVCDAHVPVHCDNRPFDGPSKIHPDLEGYWDAAVRQFCRINFQKEQFDLDENDHAAIQGDINVYHASLLGQAEAIVASTQWQDLTTPDTHWQALLGKGNNNLWDYTVAVCLVSFQVSQYLFPAVPPAGVDYNTVNIMETSPFKEKIIEISPKILADAINSTALVWLATWERWRLLQKVSSQ